MSKFSKVTDDLLREKSLWDVYLLSWKLRFPWGCFVPSVLLALLLFFYSAFISEETIDFAHQAKLIVDFGFGYAASILGFLIAGFTVFVSLTNPRLFVKMSTVGREGSSLSWLKETFAIFMHVFAHYFSFLVALILVKLLTLPGGIVPHLVLTYASDPVEWKRLISTTGLAFFGGWLFYVSLLLGRFIFNTYHTCMLSIAVEGEDLIEK
jgi:hypothetical protein